MSLSVLLIQNDAISKEIMSLLESKIPGLTASTTSIDDLDIPAYANKEHDLILVKEPDLADQLTSMGQKALCWTNLSDLSSSIDACLQLRRYQNQYPLNLRDWTLTEVLHNGKDAIIYRAYNREGRSAAIKRFKFKPHDLSKDVIHHFLNGIEKQCGVRSKNLVHFYDGGVCNHAFYLVMEYLGNGSLRSWLNSCDDAIPVTHALEWFQEIALALDCVHRAGLIHRDLKIDNIMLREDGTLALTDFGVSKKILLDAGLMEEDELQCSPHYVSPEQISGEPCTQASDIYSLGVIFFELLTGHKPYSASQAHELMMHHVMAPVPVLPVDLQQFQATLEKMMAKKPQDRFTSAIEAIQDLTIAA